MRGEKTKASRKVRRKTPKQVAKLIDKVESESELFRILKTEKNLDHYEVNHAISRFLDKHWSIETVRKIAEDSRISSMISVRDILPFLSDSRTEDILELILVDEVAWCNPSEPIWLLAEMGEVDRYNEYRNRLRIISLMLDYIQSEEGIRADDLLHLFSCLPEDFWSNQTLRRALAENMTHLKESLTETLRWNPIIWFVEPFLQILDDELARITIEAVTEVYKKTSDELHYGIEIARSLLEFGERLGEDVFTPLLAEVFIRGDLDLFFVSFKGGRTLSHFLGLDWLTDLSIDVRRLVDRQIKERGWRFVAGVLLTYAVQSGYGIRIHREKEIIDEYKRHIARFFHLIGIRSYSYHRDSIPDFKEEDALSNFLKPFRAIFDNMEPNSLEDVQEHIRKYHSELF